MKWKAKSTKPREGSTRVRRKFSWLPVHYYIDTELYYCWLETYLVKEEYIKTLVQNDGWYSWKYNWKLVERQPLYWEHECIKKQ